MLAAIQTPQPDLEQAQQFYEVLTARANNLEGVWVMASFPENGSPIIRHIRNDANAIDLMMKATSDLVAARLNVYVAPVIFHPDLPQYRTKKGGISKGTEADVIAVNGFCLDFDDDHAAEYLSRLPVKPSIVVETSSRRFQTWIFVDTPILTADDASRGEAKRLLTALVDGIGKKKVDATSKDLSHVFRVPGTLNFPSAKKIREGRSAVPQLARIVS